MPQHYSFKTEVSEGEPCFYFNGRTWKEEVVTSVIAYLYPERVEAEFRFGETHFDCDGILSENIASKTVFLEWQSRLIDCAKDQFKFKGNMEKMFGPDSYSNWIPFYKEDISPSNAYLQGMGLVDFGGEEEV